jgi:sugar-phosphatase
MSRPIDAVLFDMDGTLVDSSMSVERAWSVIAHELSLDEAALLAVCHGRPAPDTVRSFCPDADDATVERAAARQLALQYTDLADVVPTPGCGDVLASVERAGLGWAVVTSADVPLALARLGHCAIRPPVLVTADDVQHGKPSPEGYLAAAARLGVEITRCLVVEDSPVGVEAGRRAGALVAALHDLPCDVPLASLHDLAAWLDGDR